MKITMLLPVLLVSSFLISPAFADKNKEKSPKTLPAGLEKKVARGGELPPGWKKKLQKGEKLDQQVVDQGKVIESDSKLGTVTIKVDDKIIRLAEATREIIDILQ